MSMVKKEPGEFDFENSPSRRGSVSGSSHSGCSDYEDSGSIYSSSVGPDSGFNSPMMSAFSMPRLSPSQSPQIPASDAGGIRLPNAALNDLAGLGSLPGSPRRSVIGTPFMNSNSRPLSPPSMTGDLYGAMGSPRRAAPSLEPLRNSPPHTIPDTTGWQSVPMPDGELNADAAAPVESRSRSASRSRPAITA